VGAGRGLAFITLAKLWFMVTGYVQVFWLPRAFGSPDRYGVWVLVLSLVSPFNNVMVTATVQAVSKFSSEDAARAPSVVRAALRMQAVLGGATALAFALLAPVVASLLHDPALTPPVRLAAGVVLAYSFYAVFVGAANGARAFHKQAALDITFSTLRTSAVIAAALVTHSALVAVGGFVSAAATILIISTVVVGLPAATGERFPAQTLIRFFAGVAAYLMIVNLLMFVDGLLLKRLVAEAAQAAGAADPARIASEQIGFYGAAQNIARIPYQLILAVTFVIFPLVSKATFDRDAEKTRGYVRSTMRLSLLVCGLLASVLASRPDAVTALLYGAAYAPGAAALTPLVAGYVCFSLFNIAGTIINGSGRTLPTIVFGVATLALAAGLVWGAISFALAGHRDPLLWAAAATGTAMACGLALSLGYLARHFGAALPLSSIARTGLAAAAAITVGRVWPARGFLGGKLGTLLSLAASGIAFLAVAVASGELRPSTLRPRKS
jgi:stage V sporulation protein B